MKIESKKVNDVNLEANVSISAGIIDTEETKVAKKYSREVSIAGFRKGKVPVNVVKGKFGKDIEQEAQSTVLQLALDAVLAENDLNMADLVGEPSITKFDKTEEGIATEIKIFLRPSIDEAIDYKAVIPAYDTPEVADEDVKKEIDTMLKAVAPLEDIEEDRALENGDFANMNFEGFVDGEPFAGGKADGYALEIGSGNFIGGFEDGMLGMKKDEEKEIEVTFPEDYANAELAGKLSTFKVKLLSIQAKNIPAEMDDDTAKKLSPGEADMTAEKLIERTKDRLNGEKMSALYNDDLKPKLIDALVAAFTFDLPDNIVDQEINMAINNDLKAKSEEEIKELAGTQELVDGLKDAKRETAVNSVKLTFIVDHLAKKEGITVEDPEVAQTLYYEAIQTGQDPKEVMDYYEKQGLLPAVKMSMIEDKLFAQLLDTTKG